MSVHTICHLLDRIEKLEQELSKFRHQVVYPDCKDQMTILVADEDPRIHQSFRVMNKYIWGYNIHFAFNGLDAVNKASDIEPDVVIMNHHLPVMDGLQVAKWMRTHCPYFVIIGLDFLNQDALDAVMDVSFPKYFEWDHLHQLMLKLQAYVIQIDQNPNGSIKLQRKLPMDKEHAQEIRGLKEKGFVKVKFGNNGSEFILHKNTTNKISHDFNIKQHLISVFLNHDTDKPTRCELYREHCRIIETYLDTEDYSSETTQEVHDLGKYSKRALTRFEE